jgi:hypothetical protein
VVGVVIEKKKRYRGYHKGVSGVIEKEGKRSNSLNQISIP